MFYRSFEHKAAQPQLSAGRILRPKSFKRSSTLGVRGEHGIHHCAALMRACRRYNGPWNKLSENVLCDEVIWLQYAHWLVHQDEKDLEGGTVVEYLRKCIRCVHDLYGADPAHAEFFTVLDGSARKDTWLKGLVRQIYVEAFKDATARGEKVSKQATPMYTAHRRDVSRQYRVHGSPDSMKRNAVIQITGGRLIRCNAVILITGYAAGRGGEVATMSYDVMDYDLLLHAAVATWPQIKTHKNKLIALCPGVDRLLCAINSLACAHASGCFKYQKYDCDDMNYLFPELFIQKNPTTAISNYLKDLTQGSKNQVYEFVRALSLAPDVTAGSLRVGALNEMALMGVIAEFMIHVSGHDMDGSSKLWHYINPVLALMVPGITVLAGWPALPYGRLGKGAMPASFEPLLDAGEISMEEVEKFLDLTLWLREGFTDPSLMLGGRLRALTYDMGATLVLWYEQSTSKGEILNVTCRMRDVMVHLKLSPHVVSAGTKLCHWSRMLGAKFKADNLHLTGREQDTGHEQIVATVQQLSTIMGEFQRGVVKDVKALQAQYAAVLDKLDHLSSEMNTLGSMLSNRSVRSPLKRVPASPAVSPDVDVVEDDAAPAAAVPAARASEASRAVAVVQGMGPAARSALWAPTGMDVVVPSAQPVDCINSLTFLPGSTPAVTSFKKMLAIEYYELDMANRARPSSSDLKRGNAVVNCFNAVALPGELQLMRNQPTASTVRHHL